MDPPTHGLLGAAIGQAFFGRSLGSRAVGWGAVLGLLPDVDVVAIPIAGELAECRYHRALTHGLWFGPVVGAALGWALWRWRGRTKGVYLAGPGPWIALAVVNLLAHPVADAFTSYGTLLLWPSPRRFAWDALPIIDVLFSAALLLAVAVGRLRPRSSRSLSSWGGHSGPPRTPADRACLRARRACVLHGLGRLRAAPEPARGGGSATAARRLR